MEHKIEIGICQRDWTTLFMMAHMEMQLSSNEMYTLDMTGKQPKRFDGLDLRNDDFFSVHPDDMPSEEHWFTVTVDDAWLEYLRANISDYMHVVGTPLEMFVYTDEEFERVWNINVRKYRPIKNKRYAAQREYLLRLACEMEYQFTAGEDSGIEWKDLAEVLVSYAETIRRMVR